MTAHPPGTDTPRRYDTVIDNLRLLGGLSSADLPTRSAALGTAFGSAVAIVP